MERVGERPLATVAEVEALAGEVGDRWRLLVLITCWTSLRFGELAARTRADVNLMKRTVSVTKNRQRLDDGTSIRLAAQVRFRSAYGGDSRPTHPRH